MIRSLILTATFLIGILGPVACSDAVSPLPGATTSGDGGSLSNTSDAGTQ